MLRDTIILTPFVGFAVVLYHILKSEEPDKTFIFTDKNTLLHGKKYNGIEIISAEKAKERHANATVIICAHQHAKAIHRKYSCLGFTDIEKECFCFFNIDKILKTAKLIDYEKLASIKQNVRYEIEHFLKSPDSFFPPNEMLKKGNLLLDRLNVTVTTRCSLRCKDCCSCMQYYQNPKDFSLKINIETFDAFIRRVDYVSELTIIGGEPLLYQELPEYLKYIASGKYLRKIGRIVIVTNGTILPNKKTLQAIKAYGVFVYISDYGVHSKKINELIAAFEDFDIGYIRKPNITWYSWSKIIDGEIVSETETQRRFFECDTSCRNIRNGKFFYCDFLAGLNDLKAAPVNAGNYVDLMDDGMTKDDIKQYLKQEIFYPGCRWCSGGGSNAPLSEAAIQIGQPIKYKKYE